MWWDILIIAILHTLFINPLEKIITSLFIIDKRPNKQCIKNNDFKCLGMPSGHMEVATILCLLLYHQKIIPLSIAICIIILVGIQRILTMAHTIIQVVVGGLLGFLYFSAYKNFDKTRRIFLSLLIVIILIVLYKLLKFIK